MNAKDTKGNVKSKLPKVGTTIFTTMSALAAEVGAVNVSQGFPNFPPDEQFLKILHDTVPKNVYQYAPMQGLLSLREEIQKLVKREYSRTLELNEILVTAGATQALFTAIQALIGPGDEVIIIDPAYDCYRPAVDLVGGVPVHISLNAHFELDLDAISDKLNPKTRMLILNNPHNPTGVVFSKKQVDTLVSLIEKHPNCLVLSDEVYEFINFSGELISLNYYPQLTDRLITVSSFGKTLHMTGWKVGYLTASGWVMEEIKKVHQFLVFSVSHFAQEVIASYLQSFDVKALTPFYEQKKEFLADKLANSNFELIPCSGTYFQVIDTRRATEMSDVEYAIWLTREKGIATIPLSVFYDSQPPKHYLRLCFAKDEDTLTKAGNILCQI
jgi:methionine transaminase